MTIIENHIKYLFDAELQFRLASAIRIAVTNGRQPLDFPQIWTHGKHSVDYDEVSLRQDQAEYAAAIIQHSATLTMAIAVKDAIESVIPGLSKAVKKNGNNIIQAVNNEIINTKDKRWLIPDHQVGTVYHVSRLIRNAYAHAPFSPKWMIQDGLDQMIFTIPDVVDFRTHGLNGLDFDWRHYGGLLVLYKLCRFTRFKILNDQYSPRENIPIPQRILYQQGNLILEQVDKVPNDYVQINHDVRTDDGIDLGNGHIIYSKKNDD